MTKAACAIVLSIAAFAPVAAWLLNALAVSPASRLKAAATIVDSQSVLPEPGERIAYLAGCVLLPSMIGAAGFLLGRAKTPESARWRRAWLLLDSALAALLLAVASSAFRADSWFFLQGNLFHEHPWSALAILPLALGAGWLLHWLGPRCGIGVRIAAAVGCLAVSSAYVMGSACPYATVDFHFSAVFDPVAQVVLGKDLLTNYDTQYGLYADLLAVGFRFIGLSVGRFTLLLGLLVGASFTALSLVLGGAVKRPSVACLGILALLYNGWAQFMVKSLAYHVDYFDCYFQYLPIRFCFPAGLVLLYWSWLQRRSRWLYWVTAVFVSVGVLWNLDSGLIAWLAWLAALWFDSALLADRASRWRTGIKHLLAATFALTATTALYALAKYATFGHWPDFSRLLLYQRLFYVTGFNMLPMQLPGAWILVILVYLVGIARAFAIVAIRERAPRVELVFLISILGLGLFSYFQGRSHPMCLLLAWWPAMLLLPILFDEALDNLPTLRRSPLAYVSLGITGWFLVGSAASLTTCLPRIKETVGKQWATLGSPPAAIADEVALVGCHLTNNDRLFVLSNRAPSVHWHAQVPSAGSAALIQMLSIDQYQLLLNDLIGSGSTWVMIDDDFADQYFVGTKVNPGSRLLVEGLNSRLRRVASTDRATLYRLNYEVDAVGDRSREKQHLH